MVRILTVISALENTTPSSPALGALSALGASSGARSPVSFSDLCASQLSAPASNGTKLFLSVTAALSIAMADSTASQGLIINKAPAGTPNPKETTKNPSQPLASTALAAFLLLPMPSLPEIVLPTSPNESSADPSSPPTAPATATSGTPLTVESLAPASPSLLAPLPAATSEANSSFGAMPVDTPGPPTSGGTDSNSAVALPSLSPLAPDSQPWANPSANLPNSTISSAVPSSQVAADFATAYANPGQAPPSILSIYSPAQTLEESPAEATAPPLQGAQLSSDAASPATATFLFLGSQGQAATDSTKSPVQNPSAPVPAAPITAQTQSSTGTSPENVAPQTVPAVTSPPLIGVQQSAPQSPAIKAPAPPTTSAANNPQSPGIKEVLTAGLRTPVSGAMALSVVELHPSSLLSAVTALHTAPPTPASVFSAAPPPASTAAPAIRFLADAGAVTPGTTPSTNPAAPATGNPIVPAPPVQNAATNHDSQPDTSDSSDSSPHKSAPVVATPSAGSSAVVTTPLATAQAAAPQVPTVAVVDPAMQTTGQPSAPDSAHKSDGSALATSPDSAPNLSPSGEPSALPVAGPVRMAQMVSKAAQSEMRIGLNTSAFGSVEVRTVVHANDVGVLIGSEKGDLRSLLSTELPGIANNLQQQNLRLNQVNFHQGFGFSNNQSSGGDAQPRSFSRPFRTATLPAKNSGAEPNESASTLSSGYGSGLSILA